MFLKIPMVIVTFMMCCSLASAADGAYGNGAKHTNAQVEVYITSWCGYCKKTLKYLNSKGVDYVAYDIEKDEAARQRHKELGGHGVPLIVIGSHKINGFSPERIDSYLNE